MLADLISPVFFEARAEWALWLISVVGIAMLVFGADRTVGAAAKLASALGLSKVIIGATVVSLGTTSPECAVSVNAALKGDPGLALGNGIGSIICDTALIFGLCCCLTRLPKDRFVLNRHGWLQFGAGALLTGVALGLWAMSEGIDAVYLPRAVGWGFLVLLACYLYLSVRWSRQHPEIVPLEAQATIKPKAKRLRAVGNLLLLGLGLALVIGGSELLIGSVKVICERHGVPEAVIAVTFVALGTSLPELMTAIMSIIKGHPELLVGNVIGADILNVLFVIGASAAAVPLKIDPIFFYFLLPTMMVVLLLLRLFIFAKGDQFRRWQGIPLLLAYAAFVTLAVVLGVHG
jgi:cation:H+ antiporter